VNENHETLAIAILALVSTLASAETAQETAIKNLIEPRLGENVKVDSVSQTPYGGLFEVRAGADIFYTDDKAKYLFVGHVFEAQNSHDLTKDRIRRDHQNQILPICRSSPR